MTQLPEPLTSGGWCQLCTRRAQTGARLCWQHVDELLAMIDPDNAGDPAKDIPASIPQLYALIDLQPGSSGDGSRRAPGFTSMPPLSLHLVAMLDDRSQVGTPCTWFDPHPSGIGDDWTRPHTEEPNPPRPVHGALSGLVALLLEDVTAEVLARLAGLQLVGPLLVDMLAPTADTVPALCAWLHEQRDWLIGRRDVAEIHLDLLELSEQLRGAVGDSPREPEGRCIALVRDQHSTGYRECGGPLVLRPPDTEDTPPEDETPAQRRARREREQRTEVSRCPWCHRRYNWLDLIRMKYVNAPKAGAR